MFPVDCEGGEILSDAEKKFWRHTYNNMKRKTKQEWEVIEWMEKQILCHSRLEIAAKRAKLSVLDACELLINKQKGAIRGMARFIKENYPLESSHVETSE